jgi:hypothetical protein
LPAAVDYGELNHVIAGRQQARVDGELCLI